MRNADKVGVLLGQLGTPDSPKVSDVRRYLREFLSDRRVIEANPLIWFFILNFFILPFRSFSSAKLYRRVWTNKGSPLRIYTDALTKGLEERFKAEGINALVKYGMRYGNPKLSTVVQQMIEAGCDCIHFIPLFPQYSATTTGSLCDLLFDTLSKNRFIPAIRTYPPYYNREFYITSVSDLINKELMCLAEKGIKVEYLLLSYHGLPVEYCEKGDPYKEMCCETTRLLRKKINFEGDRILHCYQSRFGSSEWLRPYTDETVEKLARAGCKHIAIACPSFVCDCLETLDEIGVEAHNTFQKNGGEAVHLIRSLNDESSWIDGLFNYIIDLGHPFF